MDAIVKAMERGDFKSGFIAATRELADHRTGRALMLRGICSCNLGDMQGMVRDLEDALATRTLPPMMQVLALSLIAEAKGAREFQIPENLVASFKFIRGCVACCSKGDMHNAFVDLEDARRLGCQNRRLPLWRAVAAAHIGHDFGMTRAEFLAAIE